MPEFDSLRSDPRYAYLLRRMGLPQWEVLRLWRDDDSGGGVFPEGMGNLLQTLDKVEIR